MSAPLRMLWLVALVPAAAFAGPYCDGLADGPVRDAVLAWTAMEIDRPPACVDAPERVAFTARVDLRWTSWRDGERFERSADGLCWLQPRDGVWRPFDCEVHRRVVDARSGATFEIGPRMDDGLLADLVAALEEAPEVALGDVEIVHWVPVEDGGRWDAERDGWRVGLRDGRAVGLRRDCSPTPCVWPVEPIAEP